MECGAMPRSKYIHPIHARVIPQDYDAALALQPSCVPALLRKGQVLAALGRPTVRLHSRAASHI